MGTKITELTELTTLARQDVGVVVDDPAGTPVTKKIPVENLFRFIDQNVETLSGNKTLVVTDLPIQKLDPGGSSRNVVLPAEASSTDLVFFVLNTADGGGEDLVVQDDTPATIKTLGPGQGTMFSCDGTAWKCLDDDGVYYDSVLGRIGVGTINPTGKVHFVGAANAWTEWIAGNGTSGQSFGSTIRAGTTSGDVALDVQSYAGLPYFYVRGDGNVGIGTTAPQGNLHVADSDSHGGLVIKTYYATSGTFTADHTITIAVNVPSGAKIIGCQLHVKTALAGGETWNAQYATGATQSIATAQAVAQNTNIQKSFDVNAATDIASDTTTITIQRNSNPGVDAFTAQGEIEAVAYALIMDSWNNE